MRLSPKILCALLIATLFSCGPSSEEKTANEKAIQDSIAAEQLRKENFAREQENATRAASEAEYIAAQNEKVREDSLKRMRRHCMSKNDLDAYLWVKRKLYAWIVTKKKVDTAIAKARVEIAVAKAFGMEPLNWAKRDMFNFIDKELQFDREKNEINERLKAAQDRTRDAEYQTLKDPNWNPLKNASIYWYPEDRKKEIEKGNPYAIAVEEERKISNERENLYHKYDKETPEEKLGGAIAILLTMVVLGAEADLGLSVEAEAALSILGEAEAAVVVGETEAALSSVIDARSILIAAEEDVAALMAVEEARNALLFEELEKALASIKEARDILSSTTKVNPSFAIAMAAVQKTESKLDALEKIDEQIGITEKQKIDSYESMVSQNGYPDALNEDLNTAYDFFNQYRDSVASGVIVPVPGGNLIFRSGCGCKTEISPSMTINEKLNLIRREVSKIDSVKKVLDGIGKQ